MEGGVIRYSGTARELRDNPELLQSAYLLRGSQPNGPRPADPAPAHAQAAVQEPPPPAG
jgi:hypothetical protein